MESEDFFNKAKRLCHGLMRKLFPEESEHFDDVWDAMLPLFEKWQEVKPSKRSAMVAGLLDTTGLGFQDHRDWAKPLVALTTTLATMLEMWDKGGKFKDSEIRETLRRYANSFGAPKNLQTLIEQTALPFCANFYEGMKWGDQYDSEAAARKQHIAIAIPPEQQSADYVIFTHEVKNKSVTLQMLIEFKKQNKPSDFFLWLDESQGIVVVNDKVLRLGPRLRQVLRILVEFRGQRVTHRQLVKLCIGPSVDDFEWNCKTSRRWIIKLRSAGKGQLCDLIKTMENGFTYDGPESFCIIKNAEGS